MLKSIPLLSPIPLVYNLLGNGFPLGSPIPLVYNFLGNGFTLGSPIPLVYNIKPLGLLVLLVYNINNRSMSSMFKCHILTSIVST